MMKVILYRSDFEEAGFDYILIALNIHLDEPIDEIQLEVTNYSLFYNGKVVRL